MLQRSVRLLDMSQWENPINIDAIRERTKEVFRERKAVCALGAEILERPPGFWGTQRAIEELREWRSAFLGRAGSTLLEGVYPSQEVGPEPNGSAPLSQLGEQGLWEDNAAPAPSPGGERATSLLLSFALRLLGVTHRRPAHPHV